MKKFAEYLTESTKTYKFKIRIAGDLPEDCENKMETALNKYEVVGFSKGKTTAVVTFDTVGAIDYDKGKKNVPYSTRASQFWTNEDGNWKLMHSHWSPKSGAMGVPEE